MKRSIHCLVLFFLLLFSAFLLASCESHTHVWGEEWETDAEKHWYVCAECGKEKSKAGHVYDDDCDAVCDTCGYERSAPHTFSESYSSDADFHWYVCEAEGCPAVKEKEAHIFDNERDTACNVCGYVRTVDAPLFDGEEIGIGSKVTFGIYPQSEVTDEALLVTLNSHVTDLPTADDAHGWTSYGYYDDLDYMWCMC